ncbi:MAG: hypothetical protein VXB94_00880 [Rhodobiaceae bacterium]
MQGLANGQGARWRAAAPELTRSVSEAETAAIHGQTANSFYDLGL